MKNGFTLVELSIVLVIIGLLIGGILVGQSLIESAKINKLVNQLSQYSVAIQGFKQKFKQNPGDSTSFSPAGTGNGETGGTSLYCPTPVFEELMVWAHLSQAQMISEQYTYDIAQLCPSITANYSDTGPMFQRIDYSNNKYPLAYYDTKALVDPAYPFHSYFFHYFDPIKLNSFDKKLDDGNSDTGAVAAWYAASYASCTPANYPTEKAAQSTLQSMADALCQTYIFFSPGSSPEMPIIPN